MRAPWAMWSRGLALRLGLDQADIIALAVALLGTDGPLCVRSLACARQLDAVPLEDLLAAVEASRGPAGPAALALALPCQLAGQPLEVEATAALSHLGLLLEARVRTWLDPDEAALVHAQPTALLDAYLADPELGPALALALAGRRAAIPRRLELVALAASAPARGVEQDAWTRALSAARQADLAPPLLAWVDAMAEGGAFVQAAATFRGIAASVRPRSAPPDAEELDRAEQAAVAFLLRPGGLRSTWEIQRWGVGEHHGTLYSPWFPEAVVLQALHEAGYDQRQRIGSLLASLPEELRWYTDDPARAPTKAGEVWRGIPPDADSLGMMLQLADLAPGLPRARAVGWLAWMEASLPEDRRLPTWFYTAPGGGSSIEGPAWQYASNDCTTVRLTTMTGLLRCGLPGTLRLVEDNLDVVLPRFARPGDTGDFFYSPATAEHHFLRFARRWALALPEHPRTAEVATAARRLAHRLVGDQDIDGGWGSAHETAQRLEGVALWGDDASSVRRGLRFLDEHQRPDGAWPASPYYLMPGKTLMHVDYLASFEVSTALCLRALHVGRSFNRGPNADDARQRR